MKSLPIPHTDMMLIQTEIDVMSLNNKHKKLDINDIMRRLNTYYFTDKLDIYKPFIMEYTNYRNTEAEVMHISFVLNHTFIHIMIFFLQTRVFIDVEDKHATQTSVPIPPPIDEVDITSDVIKSIPTNSTTSDVDTQITVCKTFYLVSIYYGISE